MSDILVLRNQVRNSLNDAHFNVLEETDPKDDLSFDILAKYQDTKTNLPGLVIKLMQNIDNIKPYYFNEINLIAHLISAIPLFIANENRHSLLRTDSIYIRKNIFALNFKTFQKIIQNPTTALALSYAKQGGFFYDVDGKKFKELREKQGYSRKDMAEKMGLSSKTISNYEKNNMRTSIEHSKLFQQILGDKIIKPTRFLDILSSYKLKLKFNEKMQLRMIANRREFMKSVNEIIERTGYDYFWPKSSPFDLFIYKKDEDTNQIKEFTLIGGTDCEDFHSKSQKCDQNEFLKCVPHDSAIIYDEESIDQKKLKKKEIPYILPKDLKKLEHPKEFRKLIIKRKITDR